MADSIPHRDRWLRSQLLSASLSVSSNIAEGHGRGTLRDYIRFLEIAISSNEVENQLHFIRRNELVDSALIHAVDPTRIEVGKLLTGLLRALRARLNESGEWQRHKVSDARGEYTAGIDDLLMEEQDWLPAPGS
jgi:four helix bundle protein